MATTLDQIIITTSIANNEKPRVVTFKIKPSELHEIDSIARQLGMSRSEFIRYAIQKTINSIKNKP